jgi:hypothetical protein
MPSYADKGFIGFNRNIHPTRQGFEYVIHPALCTSTLSTQTQALNALVRFGQRDPGVLTLL